MIIGLVGSGLSIAILLVETGAIFRACPDLWAAGWRWHLLGSVLIAMITLAVYWVLLVLRDPSHLGLAAQVDAALPIAAVGVVQAGRIGETGRHSDVGSGDSGPGSLYQKALQGHMVGLYRSLIKHSPNDHRAMMVRNGLMAVYKPKELAEQFENWASTKADEKATELADFLDRQVGAKKAGDRRLKVMVKRLLAEDMDGARYVVGRKADAAVNLRAW